MFQIRGSVSLVGNTSAMQTSTTYIGRWKKSFLSKVLSQFCVSSWDLHILGSLKVTQINTWYLHSGTSVIVHINKSETESLLQAVHSLRQPGVWDTFPTDFQFKVVKTDCILRCKVFKKSSPVLRLHWYLSTTCKDDSKVKRLKSSAGRWVHLAALAFLPSSPQ